MVHNYNIGKIDINTYKYRQYTNNDTSEKRKMH